MSKTKPDPAGRHAAPEVWLLVAANAPLQSAPDVSALFEAASARAVALNDRLESLLKCHLDGVALAAGWRETPEAADALDAVRSLVRDLAPGCPAPILFDPRFARLAPVWTAVLDELGHRAIPIATDDHGVVVEDIAYRDRLLAENEAELSELRASIGEQRRRLHEILDSKSWRMTRPLRHLGALLRGERVVDYTADEDEFDAAWYLAQYPDVAASKIDPYGHYVTSGRSEGRLPRAPVAPRKTSGAGGWWERLAAPGPGAIADAATGSADTGEAFDREFYLLQYPDIASAGVDPYEHYVSHGKAEGRHGTRPRLLIGPGGRAPDPARETVLVVAHEASRTGAPVLSLNLVIELARRYNVIAMPLGGGALVEEFRESCTWLAGPMDLRGAPVRAAVIVDELVALHRPKFAVVNSIESRVVLEPLARNGVATVSLVHEFAVYTRPRAEFRNALLWADETVFSTPLTRESAYIEFPDLADKAFAVLPQGRCSLPAVPQDEDLLRREESRLLSAMRPRGKGDDTFVVLGAGFVQQRKGVDLFVQCASRVMAANPGIDIRFVWIGSGYDPERDMAYSVYLADQLRRSGLERIVRIIDETSQIEVAYRSADLLLLSSRLDPLPNVAIDAMAHGVPVLCFDRTTGIADVLRDEGLGDLLVSPYLDTHDMASKLIAIATSPKLRDDLRRRVRDVVDARFNMDKYVASLETLALGAAKRVAARGAEVREIAASGRFRRDFHGSRDADVSLERVIEFEYLRAWATGIGPRKPFPGFHPGVYRDARASTAAGDPLAHYLRAGEPAGPWRLEVIAPPTVASPPGPGRVALHVHVYYPDLLQDILARLTANAVRPDLFVSVPSLAVKAVVEPMLAAYDGRVAQVAMVPNRGRDIGPFLTAFAADLRAYEVVGHLHTKKSLDLNDPAFTYRWNTFLLDNLLGREHRMADAIVGRLLAEPGLGLVFPDDPHVVGWTGNREHAETLGRRLGIGALPEQFVFPIGTMFWARPAALASLLGLGLQWDDYPIEPLGYDGTMLHALERLLPIVAAAEGFRVAVTNVPGVTR